MTKLYLQRYYSSSGQNTSVKGLSSLQNFYLEVTLSDHMIPLDPGDRARETRSHHKQPGTHIKLDRDGEHYIMADNGCSASPKCLTCTLDRCVEDSKRQFEWSK